MNFYMDPSIRENRKPCPIRHVGVVIDPVLCPGRRLLCGISRFVRQQDHWVVHLGLHSTVQSYCDWIANEGVEGVLYRVSWAHQLNQLGPSIPMVAITETMPENEISAVYADQVAIGRMGAEHLLGSGLREFAFVGSRRRELFTEERRQGFIKRIGAAGFSCCEYSRTNELCDWVRSLPRPIGIMAADDARGVDVLNACRMLSIAVPDEVAVIGVNDDEYTSTVAQPPLSTVTLNTAEIGHAAAALLDRLMREKPENPLRIMFPPLKAITRQSTDIVAVKDPVVSAAIRFIRAQVSYGVTVEAVAEEMVVSVSSLRRRFLQALGTTVQDVILKKRFEMVCSLLAETNLTRIAIAERTGFKHEQYLSDAFKKYTGMTMTEYRQSAKQGRPVG